MAKLKSFLASNFPVLGKYKRVFVAWKDTKFKERETYSQFQEDKFIYDQLARVGLKKGKYVDIGANHPTDISNTYKLYRKGYRGIIIEPNIELINLHRKFRKDDIHIAVGCGVSDEIKKFSFSKTPVLSSFVKEEVPNILKSEYLPVYRLDTIISSLNISMISFLSIDVEGWDYEVLLGSKETLKKTYLICIEANSEDQSQRIINFLLNANFDYIKKINCNLFFKNKSDLMVTN